MCSFVFHHAREESFEMGIERRVSSVFNCLSTYERSVNEPRVKRGVYIVFLCLS